METVIRSAITTSLGAAVNGVSIGRLEEGYTLPWVTLNRIDTPRRQALGSGSPVISSKPRFQFDAWAVDSLGAEAVMELLVPAVLALPYAVTLADQSGPAQEPKTGFWRGQLDAKVNHAGT
jgi:hypothetical protein